MNIVKREGIAKASPSTIWKACFQSMKWEIWDPDVKCLKDVTLDETGNGVYNGNTMTFVMNNGMKLKTTISSVKEYQCFVFSGSVFFGCLGFEGRIELKGPAGENDPGNSAASTCVKYSFGMNGLLGGIAGRYNSKMIEEGTEQGLANIIRISEEAEKALK